MIISTCIAHNTLPFVYLERTFLMLGVKLANSFNEFALKNKMGIGHAQLKDGSILTIAGNLDKSCVDLFVTKDNRLISAKGYKGHRGMTEAVEYIFKIEDEYSEVKNTVTDAWLSALYKGRVRLRK